MPPTQTLTTTGEDIPTQKYIRTGFQEGSSPRLQRKSLAVARPFPPSHYFLFGRCVSALAAAFFASARVKSDFDVALRILEAALPGLFPVLSFGILSDR